MSPGSSNPSSPGGSSASDDFAAMLDEELQRSSEEVGVDVDGDFEVAGGEVEDEAAEDQSEQEGSAEVNDDEENLVVDDEEKEEEVDGDQVGEDLFDEVGGEYGAGTRKTEGWNEDRGVRDEVESRKRKRVEEGDMRQAESGKDVCPPHPGFMWGVCIRCGENRQTSNSEPMEVGVALRYIHEGLELTEREAARMRRDELKHVIARKKLYLVLDLDHTLLNSARFMEVPPDEEAYLIACYWKSRPTGPEQPTGSIAGAAGPSGAGESEYKDGLNRLNHLQMWTKLRPFAHEFLEAASKMFEMYVYTMGERTYAVAMARLLDPTGRYFGDRVISQGDSTRRNTKDLDVVLGAESAVVILDDTEGAERGATKRKVEDVRKVLQTLKKNILKGCRIVFSRIFPTAMRDMDLHPFWRLTEELGATCSNTLHPSATHIVALDRGTDKARWAKKHGKYLVHPAWVEAAQYLWRRPREEDFPVAENNPEPPLTAFAKTVDVAMEEVSRSNAVDDGVVEEASSVECQDASRVFIEQLKSKEMKVLDTATASLPIENLADSTA